VDRKQLQTLQGSATLGCGGVIMT